MIITFIVACIIFALLLPYLTVLGILNFKKSENMMENHLPGRPARRTVGRKNADMIKSVSSILVFYIILCGTFYGLPSVRSVLSDHILIAIVIGLSAYATYMVTPSNRLAHAYATSGQIAVIHLCCSVSTFIIWSALLYENSISVGTSISLMVMVVGGMLVFSKKQERG